MLRRSPSDSGRRPRRWRSATVALLLAAAAGALGYERGWSRALADATPGGLERSEPRASLVTPQAAASTQAAPPGRGVHLSLEWLATDGQGSCPLLVRSGELAEIDLRVVNHGDTPAHALRLDWYEPEPTRSAAPSSTATLAGSMRLQPGPRAGEALDPTLRLELEPPLEVLCVRTQPVTVEAAPTATVPGADPGQGQRWSSPLCRTVAFVDRAPAVGDVRAPERRVPPEPLTR